MARTRRAQNEVRTAQAVLALMSCLFVPVARSQEVTVQNDSFVSGQSAVIVGDFVPGEQAGARLTSPCDGAIVAVQIGWLHGDEFPPASNEPSTSSTAAPFHSQDRNSSCSKRRF